MSAPTPLRSFPTVRSLIRWAVLLGIVLGSQATASEPSDCCAGLRPNDQVWLVSHRGLGCRVEQQVTKLKYWRLDADRHWVRSSLAELQDAEQPDQLTTIFAHGNRIASCQAFTKGWRVYRKLVRCAGERPVRFVIWSWPSGQVCGPVKDARIKAGRTNPSAYYLAWLVDQLDPDEPVSLWGHSFGARVVTGALHLLGGGRLAGRQLTTRTHPTRQPIHAVLIAAALDSHWLAAGRAHGRAMSQTDRILLVNNSCDAVLKRYHWVYHRRSCRTALGYTGLPRYGMTSESLNAIEQIDACCQVGREHALLGYLCAACLWTPMRDVLLFESEPAREELPEAVAAAD